MERSGSGSARQGATTVLRGDTGAVTVEAAISIGSLLFVFALVLTGISAVTDQLRCTDAAREAARLIAMDEPDRARRAVAEIAPATARLHVSTRSDEITVRVSAEPVGGLLPGVLLRARAYAVAEPGTHGSGTQRSDARDASARPGGAAGSPGRAGSGKDNAENP